MFCISVSYKKTPLEIRQRFAFTSEEQTAFLAGLVKKGKITGGVIVSTCNRSEFYFTGTSCIIEEMEEALSDWKEISGEEIRNYCLHYQGKQAVRHLFRVVCGLDSMVLGEDEILHQVKEAYLNADRTGLTNGEMNIIFQGAFNCAKLSKSETKLSNTPVSIGTLTANAVEKYLREQAAGDGQADTPGKVLVIGATGKMGSIVVKDLLAKGIAVVGTSRRRHNEEGLFFVKEGGPEWVDFENRYDAVSTVKAVVSVTASPHYTLTREAFVEAAKGEPCLLVDLGVPRDIDRDLKYAEGVTLLDIDHFKTLSVENNAVKLGEMEKVEGILNECLEEIMKKLYLRDFQQKMADRFEEPWFQKMIYYLREVLDSEQLIKVFERICEQEGFAGDIGERDGVFSIYG